MSTAYDRGVTDDARARLLEAWRGEIEAGTVYELIARRERDPERARILRRMAEAESGHRQRLEARMRELAVEVPDPESVRLSPWLRLQARLAPLERLLAAREAAETDEIEERYLRPTGNAATDALLHDIRRDERSHALAVSELQGAPSAPAPVPAQARLDRILGRERWHQRHRRRHETLSGDQPPQVLRALEGHAREAPVQ